MEHRHGCGRISEAPPETCLRHPHSQLSVVTFLGGHMCWWSPLVPEGTPVGYHHRGEARPVPLSQPRPPGSEWLDRLPGVTGLPRASPPDCWGCASIVIPRDPGFPGGSAVKNAPATRRPELDP